MMKAIELWLASKLNGTHTVTSVIKPLQWYDLKAQIYIDEAGVYWVSDMQLTASAPSQPLTSR